MTDIMQMLEMFKQNPMQILMQKGIRIPQELSNNPQSIVQYMLNNGMVSQQQVNQAMQMVKQFKTR